MRSLAHALLCLVATLSVTHRVIAQSPTSGRALERTIRYEYRIFHPGDGPSGAVTCYVPLPWDDTRQTTRYLLHTETGFERRFTDAQGQELLEYRFAAIPERSFVEVGFTVGIQLDDRTWPRPGPPDRRPTERLSGELRAHYLAAESNYSMDADAMRATAAELVAGADSDLEKVQRIYQHITENVRYVRDGRWDPAAEVLRRGTGSCSEYNYLLSGLCRLAGLPTRCVGGSASRTDELPCTDTVFHRWTEVWLDDYGWFPLDCSRGANPRRGPERHFGRVGDDLLVWCRQPGGDDGLLGWEYRAQIHRDGTGPRLRTSHRARWFDFVDRREIEAAVRWLERGGKRVPEVDALEAALIAWDRADATQRRRAVEALAAAGRPEALRRALDLDEPDRILERLCDDRLHPKIVGIDDDRWAFRNWFRDHEARLHVVGEAFTLRRE